MAQHTENAEGASRNPERLVRPAGTHPPAGVRDGSGHQKGAWIDSWHVNPSLNKDYDCIDGLRGVAILLVLACHLVYANPHAGAVPWYIQSLASAGGHGVILFFALSGFLIAHPFWKRKVKHMAQAVPPGYGWRRFWKIYPPLALVVLLFTPAYIFQHHDWSFISIAVKWLLGWPVVRPISGRFNPVMWSIIVEVQFYIVLPVLFLCLTKVPKKACLWILPLLFLTVPAAFRWWNSSRGIYPALQPFIDSHFPSTLDVFAFGVLLAGLENFGMIKKAWARLGDLGFVLLGIYILCYGWCQLHPVGNTRVREEMFDRMVMVASAFLLCYIADPQNPRARFLSMPWLRWCGLVSYEWYLFHQPIYFWIRDGLGGARGSGFRYGLIVVGSFLTGLLIAACVYRCFSLPILKYGRESHAR